MYILLVFTKDNKDAKLQNKIVFIRSVFISIHHSFTFLLLTLHGYSRAVQVIHLVNELVSLSGADLTVFLPGCGDQQIAQSTAGLPSDDQKTPGPEQTVIGSPDRCPEQMV